MSDNKTYDNCIGELRGQLEYPLDKKSLYGKRIYDNQTANRLCYERNPVNIVEGFGNFLPSFAINDIIKYALILFVTYLLFQYLFVPQQNVNLGINSPQMGGANTTEFFNNNL